MPRLEKDASPKWGRVDRDGKCPDKLPLPEKDNNKDRFKGLVGGMSMLSGIDPSEQVHGLQVQITPTWTSDNSFMFPGYTLPIHEGNSNTFYLCLQMEDGDMKVHTIDIQNYTCRFSVVNNGETKMEQKTHNYQTKSRDDSENWLFSGQTHFTLY